jgi:hypothetical protein
MQMLSRGLALGAILLVLGCSSTPADDKKGVVIEIDNLKNTAPATWKEEAPTNKMRYMQFKLPKVGDDKFDAELVLFKGLGGSADANIARWKAQFTAPEGKKIDDVAKVEKVKVAGSEGLYLDVSGTAAINPAPFDPKSKPELRENYRMLAIHFEGPKDIYHIKLTGPAKTVESYKKGFDEWFNGLK